MKNFVNNIIDFYVIIVQISFKMTIIPYFLFSKFPYNWNLILLLNGLILFGLLFVRFGFKIYSIKRILHFEPMICFFLLLFFQFISGVIKMDLNYIIFPLILIFNFIVFIIYINNLFKFKTNKIKSIIDLKKHYFKLISSYTFFSVFQAFIVVLSGVLILSNLIPLLGNDINHLFSELISSNVDVGTQYYMPGWLSIQTTNIRLDAINLGTLSGWTHEPHVFTYLIIPAIFFIMAKYQYKSILFKFGICLLFIIASLFSFSVTSIIALSILFLLKQFTSLKFLFVSFITISICVIIINQLEIEIFNNIYDYIYNKLFNDTSSADYTSNKLSQILIPQNVFGDGILLLSLDTIKSAGVVSTLLYLLFYFLLFKKLFYFIKSNSQFHSLMGMGFMYFFLHGLKVSSSVFAMPITIYMLTILSIYYSYFFKVKKQTL